MMDFFAPDTYYTVIWTMIALAVIVFIALHRVTAGYGMAFTRAWGPSVPNRLGWVLMEAPVFFAMLALWALAPQREGTAAATAVLAAFFLLHYFQRSFIFPLLIRGKSRMPLSIILMGVTFNLVNAYMIGGWLFWLAPAGMYTDAWLTSPCFIAGTLLFFAGMAVNLHSDHVVRNLRAPGDTRHYIPRGGMYRYVTSANYFGEFIEWTGYALLTWSMAGAVFAIWTFANLAPRARSLNARYTAEFGDEYRKLNLKYIIPFIY